MMYVLGSLWGVLAGCVSGYIMYQACAGPKRDRVKLGVMWGVGIGIISFASAIGA